MDVERSFFQGPTVDFFQRKPKRFFQGGKSGEIKFFPPEAK